MVRNLNKRILAILESLDEVEAHGKASDGQCAQFLFWESFDSTHSAKGEPECTCDLGALILELSDEEDSRCVRYRRAGKRFGELPVKQRELFNPRGFAQVAPFLGSDLCSLNPTCADYAAIASASDAGIVMSPQNVATMPSSKND